jgi:phosphoglycolate phosphatase
VLQRSEIDWKSFDTFIFDLDGTLVDSLKQIEGALDSTRINFGYTATPKGQVLKKLGLPVGELLSDLDLPSNIQGEMIVHFRNELAKQISISNQLFIGTKELLLILNGRGVKIAIATSKPTYLAKMVICNSEISDLVTYVQGTDNFPAKPNPEVIKRCISVLKCSNPIMIGDRIEDIEAASAAGISSVGISQSAHSEVLLAKAGAICTFKNIDLLYRSVLTSLKKK